MSYYALMENETDKTPSISETSQSQTDQSPADAPDPPKIIYETLPPHKRPARDDIGPSDMPCLEAIGLQHYMDAPSDSMDHFNRIMEEMQIDMSLERDGNAHYLDRYMIEQAMLLDAVFRFYFAGGEAKKPTKETLALAIKAQKQSAQSLYLVRTARHRRDQGLREEHRDNSISNSRLLKNSERIRKMAERKDRYAMSKHAPHDPND